MDYPKISLQIQKLYQAMSKESNEFKKLSGLGCLTNCSRCCLKPNIMASPIEMLPLALKIVKTGQIESVLARINSNTDGICTILKRPEDSSGLGKCSEYEDRPVVCRLFGWSQVHSKQGPRLSVCQLIRENDRQAIEDTEKDLTKVFRAPNVSFWAEQVRGIEPCLAELMPINQALKCMIEKLLVVEDYSSKV